MVAVCAAQTVPEPGDFYLDDEQHRALGQKFSRDFASEGDPIEHRIDPRLARLAESEESNNSAREWWDKIYRRGRK